MIPDGIEIEVGKLAYKQIHERTKADVKAEHATKCAQAESLGFPKPEPHTVHDVIKKTRERYTKWCHTVAPNSKPKTVVVPESVFETEVKPEPKVTTVPFPEPKVSKAK